MNARSSDGLTAVMFAAQGHLTYLEFLVSRGAQVNERGSDGFTAAILAAQGGHLSCLEYLATRGGDVDAKTIEGLTAVMLAAQGEHLSCLEYLANIGANFEAKSQKDGHNALDFALSIDNADCISYLRNQGLKPFTESVVKRSFRFMLRYFCCCNKDEGSMISRPLLQ